MIDIECKDCGNKDRFVATCIYRCEVNSKGEELVPPEMKEEPIYECEKCGSTNIKVTL